MHCMEKYEGQAMEYLREAFENWINGAARNNGTPYSKESVSNYISSLKSHAAKLLDLNLGNTDLFYYTDINDFDGVYNQIKSSAYFDTINTSYHRIFSSALKIYRRFLQSYKSHKGEYMSERFEEWLKDYKDHKYTDGTVKRYIRALQKVEEWLGINLPKQVMEIDDLEEFLNVQSIIKRTPDYDDINQSHGHGDLSAALNAYEKFLRSDNPRRNVEEPLNNDSEWWPSLSEYNPAISKKQWFELLNEEGAFTDNAYTALACMYDCGGTSSCRNLRNQYGRTTDFYRATLGVQMASKVKVLLSLPYCVGKDGKNLVWPILFQGRKASTDEAGSFIWRMRSELYEALTEFGISRYLQTEEKEGEEEVVPVNEKNALATIKNYIFARGFDYPDGLIENFYLSLKSKPFVILAGTSGTGKTRLVKLFAEAIGAAFKLVSVRPDWSDGSDLFGHTDLNGNFIPGPVCAAFDAAIREPKKPVFLCLDEMNLARVEYYLSDFLSVIESREKANGHIVTESIAQYKQGIPENLYIIGTVNMDETTFPFSKKVLDRANTIEFSYVDLMPKERNVETAVPQKLPNSLLCTEYLVLATDCSPADKELVEKVCTELQVLNGKLLKANAHVGFRVRDEIVFYLLNNEKAGKLLTYEQAMDNEIMQKILPRIQGSSTAIKTLLIDMFKFCMGSGAGIDADTGNVGEQMKNAAASAKYPESAKKIGYMMTRFEDDGFTSYWL